MPDPNLDRAATQLEGIGCGFPSCLFPTHPRRAEKKKQGTSIPCPHTHSTPFASRRDEGRQIDRERQTRRDRHREAESKSKTGGRTDRQTDPVGEKKSDHGKEQQQREHEG